MQVRCPISGIGFTIFDGFQCEVTAPHPILSLSTAQLLEQIYPIFKNGALDSDTLHVFGISLLGRLPLENTPTVQARDSSYYHEFWETVIPKLIPLCRRLEGKSFKDLPTIRVTTETLSHLPYWIDELHEALSYASLPISDEARRLNREGYKSQLLNSQLELGSVPVASWSQEEKDSLVLRGIRGSVLSPKESAAFPTLIAEWADKETKFPVTTITLPGGKRTTQKAIWQGIINKAVRAGSSYLELIGGDFGLEDIQELEAHLLCSLGSSSIQSKFLFEKLAEAVEVITEFSTPIPVPSKKVESQPVSAAESTELYQMNHQPGERVLSLKEKLAIKLAKVRMSK